MLTEYCACVQLKEEAIEIAEKGADDTGSIGRITRLVRFCCGASSDKQESFYFNR
jgi:hypothetical protein